jgi:hypothetical protein
MKSLCRWSLGLTAAVVVLCLEYEPARAADVPDLDSSLDARFLDTLFGRSGFTGKAYIKREGQGVRFELPEYEKGVDHTCLYSLFALGGDFEVLVTYDWLDVPRPTRGYGASAGISVETKDAGVIKLGRRHRPKEGITKVVVNRGVPSPEGPKWSDPSERLVRAKSGKLILRREESDVTCLVADGNSEEYETMGPFPYTKGTVDKVLIYADPGGSPTSMDVRFNQISIKAIRKATDQTQVEATPFPWWGTTLIILAVLGAIAYVYYLLLFRKRHLAEA